jgi:hypothetical protein
MERRCRRNSGLKTPLLRPARQLEYLSVSQPPVKAPTTFPTVRVRMGVVGKGRGEKERLTHRRDVDEAIDTRGEVVRGGL